MAREMNDVDDFLNHRGNERGGGFFNKWKQPVEKGGYGGRANIWLHKRLPIAIFQHSFPRIVVREDRSTGNVTKNAWNGTFNCHESEAVLKKKGRDPETGAREVPFTRCPLCRMIEAVRGLVRSGKMSWTQPLFRFEGDEDVTVLHAGGIYGGFGADDLTKEEVQELRDAGITKTMYWQFKENATAKMAYVFCVIDNAHPENGVQIATETQLLGDKVKGVIQDARVVLGAEAGNPFHHPYCIQWQNNKNEQKIDKKYHALRMETVKLTPEIEKALALPSPDLSKHLAPFNIETMRATLERHCLVKNMPWDAIFHVEPPEDAGDDFPSDGDADDLRGDQAQSAAAPRYEGKELSGDAHESDLVPCEACQFEFSQGDDTCPKCGAKYDENGDLVKAAPPPPPATRKRGEGGGGKKLPF